MPNWTNPNDDLIYKLLLENDHVYEFFGGLNLEYDAAQECILGKEPLPSTMEVFAYTRHDECIESVMNGPQCAPILEKSDSC